MSGLSAAAFGPNVRSARKAAGLSQEQLAGLAGVAGTTISKAEAGLHKPRLDVAIAICGVLGLPLDEACTPGGGGRAVFSHLARTGIAVQADEALPVLKAFFGAWAAGGSQENRAMAAGYIAAIDEEIKARGPDQ